jgi:phage FluMu protein Com
MIGVKLDKIQFLMYTINSDEIRCQSCGALLGKMLKFTQGHIQIKCHRCKQLNDIRII